MGREIAVVYTQAVNMLHGRSGRGSPSVEGAIQGGHFLTRTASPG